MKNKIIYDIFYQPQGILRQKKNTHTALLILSLFVISFTNEFINN